ncbi:MAG: flavodoxin-dependent (E)-4-hydroxy-3-methylbut-2-enyl-diphosphate synthase [Deltaproteobacteria bacterium]|nr:flavodoxin-dependent (E)-4-hydroxy-3-methylbut-2-enyl-diphosphate synthase [Deltaproteobacteria bacterium]MBW2018714.1 flavodoxin-dependent (E)-4-hydroxy-3-methylbut-2-enyl-diphosphate synthase [Deltaproteobacteria bacterium]MBW2073443.1 flavodoxin-dependent (E)-4-hydroxy-3-methylbut-2-enyl-diphosphate synthase [Deltaproteobacteria bacterium]RLB83061.1 MAG: 4-hydroxy-3-methylbut-2-en-1-yl diphosphate synthase [Deltaproteobacteria bacterium]
MARRKQTRQISIGGVKVGGNAPITVQSMTNTFTHDVAATVAQIHRLEAVGCELVRVAVPDQAAAEAIASIKHQISIPLIADIHFDYRLALAAVRAGADALRINPGNIGGARNLKAVAKQAKERGIPIRVGVNAGSLEKDLLKKYGGCTPQAMVESALRHVALLRSFDFHDIKVSIKASDVLRTVEAYRLLSSQIDLPLHVGVTEAGSLFSGTVKSALGIGILLAEGIGDTIRVSLTRDPVDEVRVGFEILKALKIRQHGPEIVSCPTCGRCEIDLVEIVERVELALLTSTIPVQLAIMGCVVNGPGEAREADIGIAGGKGHGVLFKKGKVVRKVKEQSLVEVLLKEVEAYEARHSDGKRK